MKDKFNLGWLLKAVQAANLVDTISEAGPFMVFAPTNEALKKEFGEDWEEVLSDMKKTKNIVMRHVVGGDQANQIITEGVTTLQTMGNTEITISKEGNTMIVNPGGATTEHNTSVTTGNGIIYVIDKIIQDNPAGNA